MKKIGIIGAGAWATALSIPLVENKNYVKFLTNNQFQADEINNKGMNDYSFSHVVKLNSKYSKAVFDYDTFLNEIDYLILCCPSFAVKEVIDKVAFSLHKPLVFINTIKGLVGDEFTLVSEYLYKTVNNDYILDYLSLLGPSHAEELVQKKYTFVNLATVNFDKYQEVNHLFATEYFKLIYNASFLSCEWGSLIKNVYAIGNGIINGLELGINFIAYYVSCVMNEISVFFKHLNLNQQDIFNLSWIGDYIVTGFSKFSRNFTFGSKWAKLGKFNNASESLQNTTVEGINIIKNLHNYAAWHKIKLPIANKLYNLMVNNKDSSSFIDFLSEL